ncbi:MAG: triosephosphate isomerase [Rickettsiales bacterium]|nr:triosephosphate isomerase [Rickettsiales bacterium]
MHENGEKIIVANWKMFGDFEFTIHYLKHLCDCMLDKNLRIIVCPPVPYINLAHRIITEYENEQICIGAQCVSASENISSTGEISAKMLEECGAKIVMVGHSERRKIDETDEVVNRKLAVLEGSALGVILCVGEDESVNSKGQDAVCEFIKKQLDTAFKGIKIDESIMISYEPIWAIGSGKTPTEEEISIVANTIREYLGNDVRVLYGGSINEVNINKMVACKAIDGILIGRFGTKTHEFCNALESLHLS